MFFSAIIGAVAVAGGGVLGGVLGCGFLFVCVLGHGFAAGAALWNRVHPGEEERSSDWGKRL